MAVNKKQENKIKLELARDAGFDAAYGVEGVFSVNDIRGEQANNSDMYTAAIYIDICYGYRIPEVAWNVQTAFINAVKRATGMNVSRADIHIQGVGIKEGNK